MKNLYFNLDWPLTNPFSLVQAFGEHLIYSLAHALRVFSIYLIFINNNPSVSSQFPYSLSQQFDFLCFLRFGLFFLVALLAFASKDASFLCDLDSSFTDSSVFTGLQVVMS